MTSTTVQQEPLSAAHFRVMLIVLFCFFWTYAALIITIVAVIVPKSKLSWVDKRQTTERSWTTNNKTRKTSPLPQTTKTKQNTSKTDHGEKVKQAQALTTVCNQPRLSLRLQQEIVKVQCKDWPLCAKRSIFDLLPFFILQVDTSC